MERGGGKREGESGIQGEGQEEERGTGERDMGTRRESERVNGVRWRTRTLVVSRETGIYTSRETGIYASRETGVFT